MKHAWVIACVLGCSGGGNPAVCGNGIVEQNEQCDPALEPACDPVTCTIEPGCGNGLGEAGEECDDGNTVSNDGCSADCETESCGDGVVQTSEECDDTNTVDGDGCSAACEVESIVNVVPGIQDVLDAPTGDVVVVVNGADPDGTEVFVMTGDTIHLLDRTATGLTSVGSAVLPAGVQITSAVSTPTGAVVGGFTGSTAPTAQLFDIDGSGAPTLLSSLTVASGGQFGEQILAITQTADDHYGAVLGRWLNSAGDRREPNFVFFDRDGSGVLRLDPARGGLRIQLDQLADPSLVAVGSDVHFTGFAFSPVTQATLPFHVTIGSTNTVTAVQVGTASQRFTSVVAGPNDTFAIVGSSTPNNVSSMFVFDGTNAILISDPGNANVSGADVAITPGGFVALGNVGPALVSVSLGSLAAPQVSALDLGDAAAQDLEVAGDQLFVSGATGTGIQTATLDGDGKIDLVTCNSVATISNLIATSTAAPTTATLNSVAFTPTASSSTPTTTTATPTLAPATCP